VGGGRLLLPEILKQVAYGLSIGIDFYDLNDLERRNSPYFAFSPNSIALLAKYVTVVEYTGWPKNGTVFFGTP